MQVKSNSAISTGTYGAARSHRRTYPWLLHHYNLAPVLVRNSGDANATKGTHQLDVARWAIILNQTHPVRARAAEPFQWSDRSGTPNTLFPASPNIPITSRSCLTCWQSTTRSYQRQVENEYYSEDGGKIVEANTTARARTNGESISVPSSKVTGV